MARSAYLTGGRTGGTSAPVTLALDSAGLACSAVVAVGETILNAERVEDRHGQAETLLPIVDAVMRGAGLAPAALTLVAVSVGPGSFTGIRVGLAAARGIALATNAGIVGVSNFEAVAAGLSASDRHDLRHILVALESRREDIYVQFFDHACNPVGHPAAVMPAALGEMVSDRIGAAPVLLAGDAAHRAASALSHRADITVRDGSAPDAAGVLLAGLRRRSIIEGDEPQPLYLRPPDVTVSNRWRTSPVGRG